MSESQTPSSKWKQDGEQDPHGNQYDCERSALALGKLTDDELANAAFLNYDRVPALQDILGRKAKMPIVYMTAVKERIRWLSRSLEKTIAENSLLKGEVVMRKDISAKRFNEGLQSGQQSAERSIKEAAEAKENYLNENQRLTNLLLAVEAERDSLKARIDGGKRVCATETEKKCYVAHYSKNNANATLILDEGVEL
jgi:hypothetical protein